MLQRAASNAYSWWWASHIRTKQSKWLEQSLQDMEEKVQTVLKLIEEDGDSFAKRAEMYYKKRPELISFVEESYRAYRALAERYDHISNELQNANNTIASVFPEQVQFSMDEEDEETSSKIPKKPLEPSKTNVPKAPKGPEPKIIPPGAKKLLPSKSRKPVSNPVAAPVSGLKKPEAMEEIDRLQKHILALQTEKEFVKSSYENGLAKYWEFESEIKAMQERICGLKDEFGEGVVIEDDEARSLMAETAVKSCRETLTRLEEQLEQSSREASAESLRIQEVREKFASLRGGESSETKKNESKNRSNQESEKQREREEVESLRAKIKEQFEVRSNSSSSFTVTVMVDKIDELVNKVIGLETAVSSQAALVERLKSEADELQAQIRDLEAEKENSNAGESTPSEKLEEMAVRLEGVQALNRNFKDQSNNLQIHFTEANCNLDHLSDKLRTVKPDDDELTADTGSSGIELGFAGEASLMSQLSSSVNPFEDFPSTRNPFEAYDENPTQDLDQDTKITEKKSDEPSDKTSIHGESQIQESEQNLPNSIDTGPEEDEPDWQKLFTNGMEDREKILLKEYTSTLRNYKDVKKKFGEAEKKFALDPSQQMRDLRSANAKKDEEIRALRLKLGLLEDTIGTETTATIPADQPQTMSAMEEKFRSNIDELLEQNLDFWLRFSSSFHQIQEFDTEIEDLKSEITKLREKRISGGGDTLQGLLRSDARPLYKHMREIQAKLTVWLEKSEFLREELHSRFSSLCEIQEEIIKALKASAEGDDDGFFAFTNFQAAKFQGEVLNMKQENHKVADELQAGIDHVAAVQIDVERTLAKLAEDFELTGSSSSEKKKAEPSLAQAENRARVPLRSFIFGVKNKKQKGSFFSCVVTPALQRKYHGFRAGPSFS